MARRGIAERAFSSLDLLSRRVAGEPRAGSIVVALSGGPDSTALAHIYAAWVRRTFPGCGDTSRGGCIIVNHNLRRGSGREAAVVEERARQMGLTTTVRSLDLSSSTQEAARDGRLRALHSACVDIGAKAILTGHTLNDQVETFALRAMRASGVRGLAGIPTTSVLTPSPDQGSISLRRDSIGVPLGDGEVYVHRPLLDTPKSALLGYCASHGLEFVRDPSNDHLGYTRNAIRSRFNTLDENSELFRDLRVLNAFCANEVSPAHANRLEFMRKQVVRSIGCDSEAGTATEGGEGVDQAGAVELDVGLLRSHPRALAEDMLLELVSQLFASAPPLRGGGRKMRGRAIGKLLGMLLEGKSFTVGNIRCNPVPSSGNQVYTLTYAPDPRRKESR